jgi:hypothetical protein
MVELGALQLVFSIHVDNRRQQGPLLIIFDAERLGMHTDCLVDLEHSKTADRLAPLL